MIFLFFFSSFLCCLQSPAAATPSTEMLYGFRKTSRNMGCRLHIASGCCGQASSPGMMCPACGATAQLPPLCLLLALLVTTLKQPLQAVLCWWAMGLQFMLSAGICLLEHLHMDVQGFQIINLNILMKYAHSYSFHSLLF